MIKYHIQILSAVGFILTLLFSISFFRIFVLPPVLENAAFIGMVVSLISIAVLERVRIK